MKRLALPLAGFLLLVPMARAADATPGAAVPSACVTGVHLRMAQQQRIFRDILFGRTDAEEDEPGTTRYSEDRSPWIKVKDNTWRSAMKGFEQTTWTDLQVNRHAEWEGMNEHPDQRASREPRIGLFATTGVLTSELIEPVTQAYRGFRCRAAMVCETLRATLRGDEPGPDGRVRIAVPGCRDLYAEPIDSCAFDNENTDETATDGQERIAIEAMSDTLNRIHCQPLLEEVTQREGEVIRLAVTYDAAYRSMLQFAGNFDLFIDEFQGDLLSPIQDAMSLVGYLTRIPCFVSACNG